MEEEGGEGGSFWNPSPPEGYDFFPIENGLINIFTQSSEQKIPDPTLIVITHFFK